MQGRWIKTGKAAGECIPGYPLREPQAQHQIFLCIPARTVIPQKREFVRRLQESPQIPRKIPSAPSNKRMCRRADPEIFPAIPVFAVVAGDPPVPREVADFILLIAALLKCFHCVQISIRLPILVRTAGGGSLPAEWGIRFDLEQLSREVFRTNL